MKKLKKIFILSLVFIQIALSSICFGGCVLDDFAISCAGKLASIVFLTIDEEKELIRKEMNKIPSEYPGYELIVCEPTDNERLNKDERFKNFIKSGKELKTENNRDSIKLVLDGQEYVFTCDDFFNNNETFRKISSIRSQTMQPNPYAYEFSDITVFNNEIFVILNSLAIGTSQSKVATILYHIDLEVPIFSYVNYVKENPLETYNLKIIKTGSV